MSMQSLRDAWLACLPPVAYDTNAENVVIEATAVAATLHEAEVWIDLILKEKDPAKADVTLPDWERVLGLPDCCTTTAQTSQQRVADVVEKWFVRGGISKQYFIDLMARRGITITIDELGNHVWRVNTALVNMKVLRVGDRAGMRLRTWGNAAMECRLERLKPAHSRVVFSYF